MKQQILSWTIYFGDGRNTASINILAQKTFCFYVMPVGQTHTGILIFKHRLMEFAKQTGVSIIVCHYPLYCSKWNPIEHRLFSHVHRALEGCALTDYKTVQNLIKQTSTKTGLTVVVRLNLKGYSKGVKINKNDIDYNKIKYHPDIPEVNYRIYP